MRKIVLIFLFFSILFAITNNEDVQIDSEDDYIKQKDEILTLKQELDNFYLVKEQEYLRQKKDLEKIKQEIEEKKRKIEELTKKNEEILKEITKAVSGKTIKVYNKMKPKIAAKIFNKMMSEGKENVVFGIIIKLKDAQVTRIMRYLDVKYASALTIRLEEFQKQKGE